MFTEISDFILGSIPSGADPMVEWFLLFSDSAVSLRLLEFLSENSRWLVRIPPVLSCLEMVR